MTLELFNGRAADLFSDFGHISVVYTNFAEKNITYCFDCVLFIDLALPQESSEASIALL